MTGAYVNGLYRARSRPTELLQYIGRVRLVFRGETFELTFPPAPVSIFDNTPRGPDETK